MTSKLKGFSSQRNEFPEPERMGLENIPKTWCCSSLGRHLDGFVLKTGVCLR